MTVTEPDRWRLGDGAEDMSDRWGEVVSRTHLPWRVRVGSGPARPFRARVRRWWIDDLALVDAACGPSSGHRTRRHIADTDGEFLVALLIRGGREMVSQGDVVTRLTAGDAVVWDSRRTARFTTAEHLVKRSLLVPRAALQEVSGGDRTRSGITLDARSPAVALFDAYLDALTTMLPTLGQAATLAARNATLELFVGATRADARTGTAAGAAHDPVLRATMERYIDRHLAGPPISPGALARAHGLSVRTVNRVFSATGDTLGGVVRSRRLARARHDLLSGDEPVATIAHRWGFFDSSHFHRAFKAHYGAAPQEYRAELGRDPKPAGDPVG